MKKFACLDVQTDCICYSTHAQFDEGQFSDPTNLTPSAMQIWAAAGCILPIETEAIIPPEQFNLFSSDSPFLHLINEVIIKKGDNEFLGFLMCKDLMSLCTIVDDCIPHFSTTEIKEWST